MEFLKKNKYSIIFVSIIILLIILIIICNMGLFTPLYNYKKKTIKILDDYFDIEITSSQAIEKLEMIEKQVDIDYKKNNDTEYLVLSSNISLIIYHISDDNISELKDLYEELK